MSKICGIYKIISPTGKIYIGQSADIATRWNSYKSVSSKLKGQFKIYNSLKKYGAENHTFEIIEECEFDDLLCRERHWQDFYNVLDRDIGLNLRLTSCGDKKEVCSEETKERIRETKRDKPKPLEKPSNYGNIWSDELKKKIKENNPNRNVGEKNPMYGKFGILNPNFGKSQPKSEKLMANLCRGEAHKNSTLVLDTQTGIFYPCIREASEAHNIEYQHLVWMLRGKWENKTNLIRC